MTAPQSSLDLGVAPSDARLSPHTSHAPWSFEALRGRLSELSGDLASPLLSAACRLVLEAQLQSEPVAWITSPESCFFPPDFHENGIDLRALIVVRAAPTWMGRVADELLRSSAFGLIVMDMQKHSLPTPLQSRLLGLVQKHHTALLSLTEKSPDLPSLGSLISLRAHATTITKPDGMYCQITPLKDKRRAPTWCHQSILKRV